MNCKKCGQKQAETAKYCSNCGAELQKGEPVNSSSKKMWESQEAKDAFFKKRQKRTKYIVIFVVLFFILCIISTVFFAYKLAEYTSKELQGTWSCDNGKETIEFSDKKFKLNDTNKKELTGRYIVYSFETSYDHGVGRKEWLVRIELTDSLVSGKHEEIDETKRIKISKNYKNKSIIQISDIDNYSGYTCKKIK